MITTLAQTKKILKSIHPMTLHAATIKMERNKETREIIITATLGWEHANMSTHYEFLRNDIAVEFI